MRLLNIHFVSNVWLTQQRICERDIHCQYQEEISLCCVSFKDGLAFFLVLTRTHTVVGIVCPSFLACPLRCFAVFLDRDCRRSRCLLGWILTNRAPVTSRSLASWLIIFSLSQLLLSASEGQTKYTNCQFSMKASTLLG